jgi:large subunit ribosomal protein L25
MGTGTAKRGGRFLLLVIYAARFEQRTTSAASPHGGWHLPDPATLERVHIMSEFGNITVSVRASHGKGAARELRRQGKIPGILYGNAQGNVPLALDPRELHKATDPARDINTLFHLTIKEDGKADVVAPAVIVEVQRNSVRDDVIHVDFMRVDPKADVVRRIPVKYEGRAAGVQKGGRAKTLLRSVKVAAPALDFPVALVVDLTPLDVGDSLRLKDVKLPGARILDRGEITVALVEQPKAKTEEGEGGAPAAEGGEKKPEKKPEKK